NARMKHYNMRYIGSEYEHLSGIVNLNLHNMFMQSLVMVGIPGMLLLGIIMFSPFLHFNFLRRNPAFLIFHIVSIFFFMQEAALQSQAGVVFYAFFSHVFWSSYYSSKHIEKHTSTHIL